MSLYVAATDPKKPHIVLSRNGVVINISRKSLTGRMNSFSVDETEAYELINALAELLENNDQT